MPERPGRPGDDAGRRAGRGARGGGTAGAGSALYPCRGSLRLGGDLACTTVVTICGGCTAKGCWSAVRQVYRRPISHLPAAAFVLPSWAPTARDMCHLLTVGMGARREDARAIGSRPASRCSSSGAASRRAVAMPSAERAGPSSCPVPGSVEQSGFARAQRRRASLVSGEGLRRAGRGASSRLRPGPRTGIRRTSRTAGQACSISHRISSSAALASSPAASSRARAW